MTNKESEKFDAVVRQLLSVSHEEIQRRDKEWRRKRAAARPIFNSFGVAGTITT